MKSPLASTFVAVITPYQGESKVVGIRRLSLETEIGIPDPGGNVAVEIQLIDGRRDLFLSLDVENPLGLTPSLAVDSIAVQQEWGKRLNTELCWVRQNHDGIVYIEADHATRLTKNAAIWNQCITNCSPPCPI